MAEHENNNNSIRILELAYSQTRRNHWDQVARGGINTNPSRLAYHELLKHYYRYLIPPNQSILELGCGCGDLLAGLRASKAVGVDFSAEMIALAGQRHPECMFVLADVHQVEFNCCFDIIIISDLINDIWDVQKVFRHVRKWCHPDTRIILNFWNKMWQTPLAVARRKGKALPLLTQSWFAPDDVKNLLALENFEVVKHSKEILLPRSIRFLSGFFNKFLSKLPGAAWFTLTNIFVARLCTKPKWKARKPVVSVIIPARNEAGNIKNILGRTPTMGSGTELVFVEGGSTDATFETINGLLAQSPDQLAKLVKQTGKGKGDAVRAGIRAASGEILMILDADLTVSPEDLPLFYEALTSGKCEFVNGVRLVYPLEDEAMRLFNLIGNKVFTVLFSWLIGQPIKDTLCGTKVFSRLHYDLIADNRAYFGDFDPFGDFDLILGATKQNLKIMDLPIRYKSRTYGKTNIERWRHGALLFKMVLFAAKRVKFI